MEEDFTLVLGPNQLRNAAQRCSERLKTFGCVARGRLTLGPSQLSHATTRCGKRPKTLGHERLVERLGSRMGGGREAEAAEAGGGGEAEAAEAGGGGEAEAAEEAVDITP